MQYKNLSGIQLDALKEVVNIGTGNAATSLSLLLGQKVDMEVPSLNIIKFDELYDRYGDDEVVAVLVKILDGINGNVLYVFDKEIAFGIINKLTGENIEELDPMGESVIGEIGNIVSSGFMNAISEFVSLTAIASVPAVVNDMLSAIIVTSFLESGQHDEYILEIETLFLGDKKSPIGGHFYFIPGPGSLEKILKNLGID